MYVDMHTHYFPEELLDYIRSHAEETGTEISEKEGVYYTTFRNSITLPTPREFYDRKKRLLDMDAMGITKAVISISPVAFYYDADSKTGLEICQLCNDWSADYVAQYPERIACMSTIPMQHTPSALQELRRTHRELGMNALEISPVINGKMLDDTEFFPVYEYCNNNGILIYLHPAFTERTPPYDKYHGMNLIGYVQETNWAVNRLLFGGIFKKYPDLKVLTSHGGGLFPYQFGRLMHGHRVRPEARENTPQTLDHYVGNLYYDTITHWVPALQFLADNFGADHIVMGTDYPYDMGDYKPCETVNALRLAEKDKELIRHGNCNRLLHTPQ